MSRHLELMRLHDGELSAQDAAELERSLSDQDREILAGLEQLGTALRGLEREEVSRFAGVADSVMDAIEAAERPAAKVVPLAPRVESDPGLPRSRRRRSGSAAVVIGGLGLAAAAAAALWLGTPVEGPRAASPVASSVVAPPTPAETVRPAPEPVAELAEEDADPAATIEAVDFGNQGGSIFMVPAGAESTPVVWLVDDAVGARMEPL